MYFFLFIFLIMEIHMKYLNFINCHKIFHSLIKFSTKNSFKSLLIYHTSAHYVPFFLNTIFYLYTCDYKCTCKMDTKQENFNRDFFNEKWISHLESEGGSMHCNKILCFCQKYDVRMRLCSFSNWIILLHSNYIFLIFRLLSTLQIKNQVEKI